MAKKDFSVVNGTGNTSRWREMADADKKTQLQGHLKEIIVKHIEELSENSKEYASMCMDEKKTYVGLWDFIQKKCMERIKEKKGVVSVGGSDEELLAWVDEYIGMDVVIPELKVEKKATHKKSETKKSADVKKPVETEVKKPEVKKSAEVKKPTETKGKRSGVVINSNFKIKVKR